MTSEVFNLPDPSAPSGRIDFRLDQRGLEWTDENGRDRWMPFACVRLATLGHLRGEGAVLRLSGPPGAVLLRAGRTAQNDDVVTFSNLARYMIKGASDASCKVRYRHNNGRYFAGWLWARTGHPVATAEALIADLP